jgi:hypothetical protein
MGLVRNINSTYVEVNRNLKILQYEGIVVEQRLGRVRMLKLNYENPKTELLLKALRILNTQTKPHFGVTFQKEVLSETKKLSPGAVNNANSQ